MSNKIEILILILKIDRMQDMIKAILFDLDGVLIETEKETFTFYQNYLKEHHKITLPNSAFAFKAGKKSVDFWNAALTPEQRALVDTKALTLLKRKCFIENPERFIKKVAGGEALLELLQRHGYKLALGSQNEAEMIKSAVGWLDVAAYFQAVLTISDIKQLKPSPEIYLLAAHKLKVEPGDCVVIEDSKDGIEAAKNANMKCIAIEHPYTPPGDLDQADVKIQHLSEVTIPLVRSL